jgi:hypothetical protein
MSTNGNMSIALVFGIPVSLKELRLRFSRIATSDFLTGASVEEIWKQLQYHHLCDAADALSEAVESVGGTTFRRAGRDALHKATAHFDTVVLVSHWKSSAVDWRDFRKPADELYQTILNMTCATGRRLHRALERKILFRPKRRKELDAAETAEQLRVPLADFLNEVIQSGELISDLANLMPGERLDLGPTLSRDLLDEALGHHLRPGNALELFDGVHPLGVIETAIHPAFTGTLDLSVCNSIVMARFLGGRTDNRFLVLSNRSDLAPRLRMNTIRVAVERLLERKLSYFDARVSVDLDLITYRDTTDDTQPELQ